MHVNVQFSLNATVDRSNLNFARFNR